MTRSGADDFLGGVIGEIVREHLGSVHVVDVRVRRDEYDDDVLLVSVILDESDAEIDNDDALALVSYIQPRLSAENETAFPVISFTTAQEWEATV